MKYWKYVYAGDYKSYGKKLYDIFLNHRYYFDYYNSFWNPIKEKYKISLIDEVFELRELETIYGEINEIAVLVLKGDESNLHIDHTIGPNSNIMARLNTPIMNCEYSTTAFYDMDEETYSLHHTHWDGGKSWPRRLRHTLTPVTEVRLDKPTILRTSSPHTVFCKNSPRVALTISFKEDLTRFIN